MKIKKIKNIIKDRRVPYFLERRIKRLVNLAYFLKNRFASRFRVKNAGKTITFKSGFHGETGSVFAIASIANLLSRKYDVEFITTPYSNYNKLLGSKVRLVKYPGRNSELFIVDPVCEHTFFEELKNSNKKIIVTSHGFLNDLHGMDPDYVKKSLSYADIVHFVSHVQQESFRLEQGKFVVIPNTTKRIYKTTSTNNAGCVGNLNEKRKNAARSVEISLKSDVENIHLFSRDKDSWGDPRVIVHQWESNKEKIYNSFDVLVFMSELETFGLVVIEAMSAGVPCLLSDIPAFEQFRGAPGVSIIKHSKYDDAYKELNRLMKDKYALRQEMIDYFENNYSEAAISSRWYSLVSGLLVDERQGDPISAY